jgi:hypothetical protein
VGRGPLREEVWGKMIDEGVGRGVQWLSPAEGLVLERVLYPLEWGDWREIGGDAQKNIVEG